MGLLSCRTILSYSFVFMIHWMLCLFCRRVVSVACDAARSEVAMEFSRVNGGRFSSCRFGIVLAMRRILRVSSLRGLDSIASVGHWLNFVRMRCVWEWARYPLFESLFMELTRCSIPIWVALSLTDERPMPISFSGRWTPSVGKFERRPVAR